MTFPTIAATNTSEEINATTSHDISLPSGIAAGHLLLVFFATDGDNTVTDWDGFTQLYSFSRSTNDVSLHVAYKIATGSEGATITITTSVSEPSGHATYRITGHDSGNPPEVSSGANGYGLTADPDSLDPSWAQNDTLWVAVCGVDRQLVTGYPTNYNLNQLTEGGGVGGASIGVAGRNLNADSEDPSTFSIYTYDGWIACTVGVCPTGEAPPSAGVNERMINRLINGLLNDRIN